MDNNLKNRDKLISCAKKEFLEKGFMKASLRQISSDAGLTTGAVYFFFKDKNGLFGAVVGDVLERIMKVILDHFNSDAETDISAYQPQKGDHDAFAEDLVSEMYDNYDTMMILLDRSQGSEYEDIAERFVDITDKFYNEIAYKYAELMPGKKVNMYMLHWMSHMEIDAFIHLLHHVQDKDTALKQVKPMLEYFTKGWLEYILEDENEEE